MAKFIFSRRSFIKMACLGSIAIIKGCRSPEDSYPISEPGPKPYIPFRDITWEDIYTDEVYDHYNGIFPNENNYANKVYIDPEYKGGDSDGTIEKPLTSLLDIKTAKDTAYLVKRGTTHSIDGPYRHTIAAENIMVGAYGEGQRPEITDRGIELKGLGNVFRDIVCDGVSLGSYGDPDGDESILFNVKTKGIAVWSRNNKIIGCEVTEASTNGIFIQQRDMDQDSDMEIAYCYIHKINQLWFGPPRQNQTVASGDCIQLGTSFRGDFWLHHNILDRSDTGNKFCIICNIIGYDSPVTGTIENNLCFGPMSDPDSGNIIYLEQGDDYIGPFTIRNNILVGTYDDESGRWTGGGIVLRGASANIYGNIIKNVNTALSMSNDAGALNYFYNNTVVDITGQNIMSAPLTALHNNIFESNSYYIGDAIQENNIFLDTESHKPENIFKAPEEEDYRLKKDSPAINAGVWKEYMHDNWEKDMLGHVIPHDDTIDIGAIQYN